MCFAWLCAACVELIKVLFYEAAFYFFDWFFFLTTRTHRLPINTLTPHCTSYLTICKYFFSIWISYIYSFFLLFKKSYCLLLLFLIAKYLEQWTYTTVKIKFLIVSWMFFKPVNSKLVVILNELSVYYYIF